METNAQMLRYLDPDGKIKQWPGKHAPQYALLQYLAEKFDPDQSYTERQVNEICDQWHTFGDYFLLRRELVEAHLLNRERDGSRYWRAPESITKTE